MTPLAVCESHPHIANHLSVNNCATQQLPHPPLIKAVRPPAVGEEANRDGLPKSVQLQAARPHCVHHTRVVNDVDGNATLSRTQLEVCWFGGSVRECEGEVVVLRFTNGCRSGLQPSPQVRQREHTLISHIPAKNARLSTPSNPHPTAPPVTCVCCGSKWVPHHQEGHINCLSSLQNNICCALNHLTISNHHLLAVQGL